ncbi:MAG TPA: hypothetical protein VNQ79_17695 [Blastocatellia bacterium]|nr:hypothetical protein [Blastocatellia bacterium]
MKRGCRRGALLGICLVVCYSIFAVSAQEQAYEHQVIGYQQAGRNDAVARLQQRLDSGEVRLEYSEADGYLRSVLKLLGVPVSSQGLVFSKTSFQLHRISPANPRAIYFNDDVYVGWVRGGEVLEVAAADPKLGGVFYMLEQTRTARPRFIRNDECLQCHASNNTRNVPGFVVRSVFPDEKGYPLAPLGSRVTNHSSPLSERWGGWYVTGTHGDERHLGNLLFTEKDNPDKLDLNAGANVLSLERKFDPTGYLSPHSDIVALMVLEHQTQMHNLLTRLGYETRLALHQQEAINQALGQPNGEWSDSTRRRIQRAADEALKYLLFVGEAKFRSPISGTSSFAREFSVLSPRDKQGRSLRDFDLKQKLFRYPCSYLIYSAAFDELPRPALDYLTRRLWLVLTGQERDSEFASIPASDRRAVLEILRETKKTLPAYFQQDR